MVEAVAQRTGITRAATYQQFGDLRAPVEEVVRREATRSLAQTTETAAPTLAGGNAQQRMLESLRVYLRAPCDHLTTWRLVPMPPAGATESLRTTLADSRPAVLK